MEKRELFENISMKCLTQLELFEEVDTIDFKANDGLQSHQFLIWEKRNSPFKLFDELKSFYSVLNGFTITWKISLYEETTLSIGCMEINRLEDIKRIIIDSNVIRNNLNDYNIYIDDANNTAAFVIDSNCEIGQIIILYSKNIVLSNNSSPPKPNLSSNSSQYNSSIWLIDKCNRWHFICYSFNDYLRLLYAHFGIYGWQLAFTPEGLIETTKQWLGMFAKERLCTDIYYHDYHKK